MADDLKNQPAYECKAYCQMKRAWEYVRDVCEGTLHLRDLGVRYLPIEPAEDSKDFSIRRSRAIFFNAFERTLHGLVGMVFRKEPKLGADVPEIIRGREAIEEEASAFQIGDRIRITVEPHMPGQSTGKIAEIDGNAYGIIFEGMEAEGVHRWYTEDELEYADDLFREPFTRPQRRPEKQTKLEGWAENIDLAGTHWTVFAKETFTDAMRDGHAFIYVDMPPALPEGATLADEIAANRRPYWVSYCADQAVNWITGSVNGQTKLLQITFCEKTCEPDGIYGEKEVTRYRVLRPGQWYLYEEVKGQDGKISYADTGKGTTSLTEIPVAVIYTRKTGLLRSKPPLLDLALINVAHYQKYSDYSTYLHIASRPVLWFRGRDTNKKIEAIGPYTYFDVAGDNGIVDFAETTGAALSAGRDDLGDLEQRMSVLGLSLLSKKNPTPTTATEELLTHVKEESDLATAARSLKDAVELALKFTIQYQEPAATSGGSVELGSTIEELSLTPQEIQTYSNMVAGKQLSLETLWAMLGRAGKLPADFDPGKEKGRIEADAEVMAEKMLRDFESGGGLEDPTDPIETERTPDEIAKLVTAAGTLIRAGFDPQQALSAVGLDPIEHLGLLPVTLQDE